MRSRFLATLFTTAIWAGGADCASESLPSHSQILRGVGLGSAGSAVISSSGFLFNRYSALAADAARGDRTLILDDAAGGLAALLPLAPGDQLLIIQMQGASMQTANDSGYGALSDLAGAGRFEFAGVAGYDQSRNSVTLSGGCGGLRNAYRAASGVQVVFVPQYQTLTVSAGASVVAPLWNGRLGGVVAAQVKDELLLDGVIDVSAAGFRGGIQNPDLDARLPGVGSYYYASNPADGGNKGEGVAGSTPQYATPGPYGRGAPGNGGGAGNRVLAGGGGGANGGDPALWSGQGVMLSAPPAAAQAFSLDPGYAAAGNLLTTSSGGGRGGYSLSSAALSPLTVAPGDPSWGGDYRRERGGLGGRPVPSDPAARLFLGGGGGSGDDYAAQSGSGGAGGGLVIFAAARILGSGGISANGGAGGSSQAANPAGAGGGGAGGTVVLFASAISGISIHADGGSGGNVTYAGPEAAGPGGGGGGGYVALPTGTAISASVLGGGAGQAQSSSLTSFPQNGATDGASGEISTGLPDMLTANTYCGSADLSISLQANPNPTQHQDPVQLVAEIQNLGPSAASAISLSLTPPAGAVILGTDAPGFSCTPSMLGLDCARDSLDAAALATVTVTLIPPPEQDSLSVQAAVASDSLDPISDNNTAVLALSVDEPLYLRATGGGVSCTALPAKNSGAGASFLLLILLLVRRRLRRARGLLCA